MPQSHMDMLSELGSTLVGALEMMIADVRAGRMLRDALDRDLNYIQRLNGRRAVIANEVVKRRHGDRDLDAMEAELGRRIGNTGTGRRTTCG